MKRESARSEVEQYVNVAVPEHQLDYLVSTPFSSSISLSVAGWVSPTDTGRREAAAKVREAADRVGGGARGKQPARSPIPTQAKSIGRRGEQSVPSRKRSIRVAVDGTDLKGRRLADPRESVHDGKAGAVDRAEMRNRGGQGVGKRAGK